jgi:hypothetical protein
VKGRLAARGGRRRRRRRRAGGFFHALKVCAFAFAAPLLPFSVTQGGALVFDGDETVFAHKDSGILKYVDVNAMVDAALARVDAAAAAAGAPDSGA